MIFTKKKILLISEGSRIGAEGEKNLDPKEFSLQIAEDSASGVEIALKTRPDVILLDMKDPFEVISTLKPKEKMSHTAMLVFTEGDSIAGAAEAEDFSADDFISKNFDENTFGEIVKLKMEKFNEESRKDKRVSRTSVLIIDDEDDLRRIVEFNLHREGFKVYSAADGPSGIKLARKHKPEVILLDVMMPGMDGIEVLDALRYKDDMRKIPVFMLTAKTTMEDVEKAFNHGAVDYITKPFEGNELGNTIRTKLKKCQ